MAKGSRGIALSLLAAILLAAASPASALVLRRNKATPIGSAVVGISVFDWRGVFLRNGWGFFIDDRGHILTVRSLLEGGYFVEVNTTSKDTFTVDRILAQDPEGNLVLMGTDLVPDRFSFIQLAGPIPREGDRVLVGGGQGCDPGAFLDGTVQAVRKVPIFGHMMRIESPYAAVGSPVFSPKGELVGIVLFGQEMEAGAAWAVGVGRAGKMLAAEGEAVPHLRWAERLSGSWLETTAGSYLAGLVLYWSGNPTRAMAFLQRAATDERFSKESYFLLGCCNDALEHFSESVRAYSMATELDPESQGTQVRLAAALLEAGDLDHAIEVAWAAVRLQANDAEPYLILARAYNRAGDFQRAVASAQVSLRLNPASAQAYREAGVAFRELGLVRDAVRSLEAAIEKDPRFGQAYMDLAVTHLRQGDRENARRVCNRLKEVDAALSERLSRELNGKEIH